MGVGGSILDREHVRDNLWERIERLEQEVAELKRVLASGLFEGTTLVLPTPTEGLEIVDAGSAGATAQDWVEVTVGGVTGYVRVYASK